MDESLNGLLNSSQTREHLLIRCRDTINELNRELKYSNQKIDKLQSQNQGLNKELLEVQSMYNDAHVKQVAITKDYDDTFQRIRQLERDKMSLEHRISSLEIERDQQIGIIQEYEESLESLESQNKVMIDDNTLKQSIIQDLNSKIDELENSWQKLKNDNSLYAEENQELKQRYQNMLEQFEEVSNENNGLYVKNTEKQKELKDALLQLQEIKLEFVKEKAILEQQQAARIREISSQFKADIEKQEYEAEKQMHNLHQTSSTQKLLIQQLQEELDQVKFQLKCKTQEYETAIQEKTTANHTIQTNTQKFKSILDEKTSQLNAALFEKEQMLSNLKLEYSELQAVYKNHISSEKELQQNNHQLMEQNQEYSSLIQTQSAQLKENSFLIRTLESKLEDSRQLQQTQYQDFQYKIEHLQQTHAYQLKQLSNTHTTEIQSANFKIKQLYEEEQLKTQTSQSTQYMELLRKKEELESIVVEKDEFIQSLNGDRERLRDMIGQLEESLSAVTIQLEQLISDKSQSMNLTIYKEKEARIALERENEGLRENLGLLQQKYKQQSQKYQDQLKQQEAENNQLRDKHRQYMKQKKGLAQEVLQQIQSSISNEIKQINYVGHQIALEKPALSNRILAVGERLGKLLEATSIQQYRLCYYIILLCI